MFLPVRYIALHAIFSYFCLSTVNVCSLPVITNSGYGNTSFEENPHNSQKNVSLLKEQQLKISADYEKNCTRQDPNSYYDGVHIDCVCMYKYYHDSLTDICEPCVPCCKAFELTIPACVNQGQTINRCAKVEDCSVPLMVEDLTGISTTDSLQVTWKPRIPGESIWDAYEIKVEQENQPANVPVTSKIIKDPDYDINSFVVNALEAGGEYTVKVTVLHGNKKSDPSSVTVTLRTGNFLSAEWFKNAKNTGFFVGVAELIVILILAVGPVTVVYKLYRKKKKAHQPLLDDDHNDGQYSDERRASNVPEEVQHEIVGRVMNGASAQCSDKSVTGN
ncbi:uncharacterized protein LOC144432826 isoform X2 [Glandiceps talaboti]